MARVFWRLLLWVAVAGTASALLPGSATSSTISELSTAASHVYDTHSAPTTFPANTRIVAAREDRRPMDRSRSGTSRFALSPATKGGRAADDVPASTPVGRRGRPMEVRSGTNAPAEIGGWPYSGHALDRMQGRGVPPSAVEDAIASGQGVTGRGGSTIHYSAENHLSVVVGRNGRVVTVGYGRFKP